MKELIFHKILEMSLIGSYCFLLILPVRLFLIRCSRKYAYYLWFIVFFNLAVPIYPKWKFSLIPHQVVELSSGLREEQYLPIQEGNFLGLGTIQHNDLQLEGNKWENAQKENSQITQKQQIQQIIENMVFFVWVLGIVVILCFNIWHMVQMYQRLAKEHWESWDKEKRVVEVRGLPAPFLWGIFHPIIYLPSGLEGQEKQYIIAHECCHLKRKDFILKLAVFIVVIAHWFNPVVWTAWMIFCQDMEISCDEEVLAGAEEHVKKQYAKSLLKYAAMQNGYLVLSVTFGEPSVKTRIKNVLRFRKHNAIITGIAGLIVVVMAMGLVVHPTENGVLAANQIKVGSPKETENNIIENFVESIQQILSEQETSPLQIEKDNAYIPQHREGYKEAELLHIQGQVYFTPELWDEEEINALAQRAIRELYDLTGFQIESCVYSCSDNGAFWFAKTEYNLEHNMLFYFRQFGEREGYSVIPSMSISSARRLWFSDVQQLDIPWNIEQMEIGEAAVWFLQHSAVYQGEKIVGTEPMFEPEIIKVITEDGSFYEMVMDWQIRAAGDIAGPYPEGFSH